MRKEFIFAHFCSLCFLSIETEADVFPTGKEAPESVLICGAGHSDDEQCAERRRCPNRTPTQAGLFYIIVILTAMLLKPQCSIVWHTKKISLGLNRANFSDTVNQWVIYDAYVSYEYQKELQVNMLDNLAFKYFLLDSNVSLIRALRKLILKGPG